MGYTAYISYVIKSVKCLTKYWSESQIGRTGWLAVQVRQLWDGDKLLNRDEIELVYSSDLLYFNGCYCINSHLHPITKYPIQQCYMK